MENTDYGNMLNSADSPLRRIIIVTAVLSCFLLISCTQGPSQEIAPQSVNSELVGKIVESELVSLAESTVLTEKFFIEYDGAETYTVWLYVEREPTMEEMEDFGTSLAKSLTSERPDFYYNFQVFPQDSKKRFGDTQVYDTYSNFA